MKHILFSFSFFFILGTCILSQVPSVPSPNAASLGIFGQIPVSHCTGVPNISFPLYTIEEGDIEIPIVLNYHSNLVKPDHNPGWVGLGWSLSAGGTITRIPKGSNNYDEYLNPDNRSYYDKYGLLSGQYWYSANAINNNINYFIGNQNDLEPDEFVFNFGNYSGSFFLNHEGKWVVKSKDPINLKIKETVFCGSLVVGSFNFDGQLYTKFDITTEDGFIYTFGALNGIQNTNAIEFSISGQHLESSVNPPMCAANIVPTSWHLAKIQSPDGDIIELEYYKGNSLYHLSKYFNYSCSSYSYKMGKTNFFGFPPGFDFNGGGCSFSIEYLLTLIYPSYLDKIKYSSGRVEFSSAPCNALDFDKFKIQEYVCSGPGEPKSEIRKLDAITVYRNDEEFGEFNFFYNVDETDYDNSNPQRLFLKKLIKKDKNGIEENICELEYKFQNQLPPYNSGKIDHWGYYTGKEDYFNNISDDCNLRSIDEEHAGFMHTGILEIIKYPTGGYTKLEFEPHYYSKVGTRYPFSIVDKYENKITGGLRIRKINSFDSDHEILLEKEYFYVNDFINGGTISSGILAGEPAYKKTLKFNSEYIPLDLETEKAYFTFSDNIVEPLSYTNGSHIMYSEVTEKVTGNGCTIYKFTGLDEAIYRDEEPLYYVFETEKYFPVSSKEFTRGLLKSEEYYIEGKNKPIKKISYEYNITPNNPEGVRAINYIYNGFPIAVAYYNYIFCPTLKEKTITTTDKDGNNPVIEHMEYKYSDKKIIKATKDISDGRKEITEYRYPLAFPDQVSSTEIEALIDKNILSPVIQELKYIDDGTSKKVNSFNYIKYNEYHDGILKPKTIYDLNTSELLNYSGIGNTTSYHNTLSIDNGVYPYNDQASYNFEIGTAIQYAVTCELIFDWEMDNLDCGNFIVQIRGPIPKYYSTSLAYLEGRNENNLLMVDYEDSFSLGPGNYTIDFNFVPFSGKTCYFFGTVEININVYESNPEQKFPLTPKVSYKYDNKGNIIEVQKTDDIYVSYIWGSDKNFPLAKIEGVENDNIISNIKDNLTARSYTLSTLYDDVKIDVSYLKEQLSTIKGLVTIYTYSPLIGITSITDPNGVTTYYEYDGLGRLKYIKDDDGNILKSHEYHYKE